MKVGYRFRRILSFFETTLKRSFNIFYYLSWLLFEPAKFKIKPKKIKNILIISAGAIGDTYNLLGMLNQVIKNYPEKVIYYFSSEKNLNFAKNPQIKKLDKTRLEDAMTKKLFDCVLICSNPFSFFDRRMYQLIQKIPYRIGLSDLPITPLVRDILPNQKYFLHLNKMIFQRWYYANNWIALLKEIGIKVDKSKPIFYFTSEGNKAAENFVKKHKSFFSKKVIFLQPGAGSALNALSLGRTPSHVWPNEKWVELSNTFLKKYPCSIIFTGSGKDTELNQEIISKLNYKKRVLNASSKLSIESLAYLMKNYGRFFVSMDTGTAHIGALSGIPTIDIFSSFPPDLSAPLTKNVKIIYKKDFVCTRCIHHDCPEGNPVCTNTIPVSAILSATEDI